ncbi:MAG: hypothetical protein IKP55_05990, partial [Clostridia bacterium]|nr:hypothetical protein [Clostridia bacterium]
VSAGSMLFPERFSRSITFSSFSKFLFGIPCTFTFVSLPSISVLEILLFNFQRSCARSLPEVSSLSGRAFLFYYLPPILSRGFFNFFRDFKKKDGRRQTVSFFRPFALFSTEYGKKQPENAKNGCFQKNNCAKNLHFLI